MSDRHAIRHATERVGALVILTLVVVGVLTFGSLRARGMFEPVVRFEVLLPETGSEGLGRGAHVWVAGTDVGTVEAVDVLGERMTARVRIPKVFEAFVRTDSPAVIRRAWGVAGDAYLEIMRGKGPVLDPDAEGQPLRAESDRGAGDLIREVVDQLRNEALPMLSEARAALVEFKALAVELRDPDGRFQRLLARAESVSESVEQGDGLLGRIIHDKGLADDVTEMAKSAIITEDEARKAIVDARALITSIHDVAEDFRAESDRMPSILSNLDTSLSRINTILANIEEASAEAPGASKVIAQEIKQIPGLVTQAWQSLREIERVARAAQKHWFLRQYVEPDHGVAPIDAADMVGPEAPTSGGPR